MDASDPSSVDIEDAKIMMRRRSSRMRAFDDVSSVEDDSSDTQRSGIGRTRPHKILHGRYWEGRCTTMALILFHY